MAFRLPFSLPYAMPPPRRAFILFGSLLAVLLLLHIMIPGQHRSVWSSDRWLPGLGGKKAAPPEFDENGLCLFVSPFDALSDEEKRLAEQLEIVESTPGIVSVRLANDSASLPLGKVPHPFLALLKDGEKRWTDLNNRQSKTLEEAYNTYKRKWGRAPPKGFDDWYWYARDRDTLLIDEFDAVMEGLLPYYALPIPKMKERLEDCEKIVETFSLIVNDHKVELKWNDDYARDWWWSSRTRADAQVNLMETFLHFLPDLRATYTIHDQPSVVVDYERSRELIEAARHHKVLNTPNDDDKHVGDYTRPCAPDSALRKGVKEQPAPDTFVNKHIPAMNPCDHPYIMDLHGMFLEKHDENTRPTPHTKLFPIFALSKTVLNMDIPITPVGHEGNREDVGLDPEWRSKQNKVYWRGLATGMNKNKGNGARWRDSHRERLHFLANDKTGKSQTILEPVGTSGEAKYETYGLKKLGEQYMNVKLADGPWQCDEGDGTCGEMRDEIDFGSKDPKEEPNKYKYVIDTDGNAWSSRFPRLMAAYNLVIKATVFPEWNSHHLPEWYAYVPTKADYSDLYSIIAWFLGAPGSGRGGHDEVARRIARNGQCWSERTWRKEDQQVYMFRLYLEYARAISPDRDNGKMDFVLQDWHRDPAEESHHGHGKDKTVQEVEAIPGIDQ